MRSAPRTTTIDVVVVDDGSGPATGTSSIAVADLGADGPDRTPTNRGKGAALKSGFGYIGDSLPGQDVVCADCDGQHTVADILRVADRICDDLGRGHGARRPQPSAGDVPLRSRFGNSVSRSAVPGRDGSVPAGHPDRAARPTRRRCSAGCRRVQGERYEYELNLLMQAADAGMTIETVEIATVYLEENESSHFRPVVDSVRIYAPLLKFALSSITAFLIDTVALLALMRRDRFAVRLRCRRTACSVRR